MKGSVRFSFALAALIVVLIGSSLWVAGGCLLSPNPRPSLAEISQPAKGIEEVRLRAADGVALRGWWWPGKEPRRAVVLLHGWRVDHRSMLPRARWIHDLGYSALLFDFRGCGESAGGRTTFGFDERQDVEGALRFLREEKKVPQVALIGISMGGAAALMAVDQWEGVRGVILESVYARFEDAVRNRVREVAGPLEPVISPCLLWQVRPRFGFRVEELAPVERIRRISCPSLIISGGRDAANPTSDAGALFSAAPSPASIWILQRAGHADFYRFEPEGYRKRVGEFLAKALGPVQEG